jgi:predicted RNase H-like nuclease (RuvC/YqgF family)
MPEDMTGPPGMPQEGAAPPPPKKPAPGLFAPKPKPGIDMGKNVSDLAGELNNVSRRLMVLEERYTNLRKKTQVTDQNMLTNNKKVMTEIQTTNSEIDELKKQLADIIDKMKIIVRELKDCAKKQEVDVLNKYINIWQPINFITRDSALKLIRDEVESQFKDLNIRLQQEDYIKEQIRLTLQDTQEGVKKGSSSKY